MKPKKKFSSKEAREIGDQLGIDWRDFGLKEFQRGLAVELEHGSHAPDTDVTHDDPRATGKIAWAHLKEFPDYYTRLDKLEADADKFWTKRRRGLLAPVNRRVKR